MLTALHLRLIPAYLLEVAARAKVALGGGSALILFLGLYQGISKTPIEPSTYIAVVIVSLVFAQLWHGLVQFKLMNPPFRIGHPKHYFWPVASRGASGIGYYFDVLNPSATDSLESVRAQLVGMEPLDISDLPIPLHIRHLRYLPNETEVLLTPNSVVGFDIATGPDRNTNSQGMVLIPCVVGGDRGIKNAYPISGDRHVLHIRIMARNYSKDISLEVWVEDNLLRCQPRQNYVLDEAVIT